MRGPVDQPGRTLNSMGFTRAHLAAQQSRTVPDLLPQRGRRLRLLLVGINPGLWTAAAQAHFARPGNRFWPALYAGGVLPRPVDVSAGMSTQHAALVTGLGIGITNLVARATARADELTAAELAVGAANLESLVSTRRPDVVAVLGVTAYRSAFGRRKARIGDQPESLAGARLIVAPNPSGLNAHVGLADLARVYRSIAVAAGIIATVDPGAVGEADDSRHAGATGSSRRAPVARESVDRG